MIKKNYMGAESLYIRKIEGAIVGIKNNTKDIQSSNIFNLIKGLSKTNKEMAEYFNDKLKHIQLAKSDLVP
jgi:hypothetical protein